MYSCFRPLILLGALSLFSACANIIPPTGGKTDTTPPKLLSIKPADSLVNTRVTRIDMRFNEYVVVSEVSKELHVSPMLSQSPLMTVSGKTVTIKIADSLLQDSTTYTIDFGKSIRDLHEGNAYTGNKFRFSTGPWFDSLKLSGYITNAASGKRDSSGSVKVLLYYAGLPYDIVTRQKPSYVTNTDNNGTFRFEGLPDKAFRVFALKETGDNLKFDADDEWIGFADTVFRPFNDTAGIALSIFKEIPDSVKRKTDTGTVRVAKPKLNPNAAAAIPGTMDSKTFNYKVNIDTGNTDKRTYDITRDAQVFFSRKADTINRQRIFLSADSNGIEVETKFTLLEDTSKMKFGIQAKWRPNTVYTLRLLKGFAADTGKNELMPSKYIFRTKSDEDYGKLEIIIPDSLVRSPYLLQVLRGDDSVYQDPVKQPKIQLSLLPPGDYTILIIEDTDGNGEWTTGELSKRRQPEKVIPYSRPVFIKAGWEHRVDFAPKKK